MKLHLQPSELILKQFQVSYFSMLVYPRVPAIHSRGDITVTKLEISLFFFNLSCALITAGVVCFGCAAVV